MAVEMKSTRGSRKILVKETEETWWLDGDYCLLVIKLAVDLCTKPGKWEETGSILEEMIS